ncbi:MAG: 2-oxoacid:acceptor oxidoreductase family protein [Gammaproteobacteria bacterium]|nr:2-oxoacid:acceptor oxidoreductase family protein [Gammaproteobacteria bacterium]MDH3464730.1 2-oxoacid:acceptor oxidoreductase family protein [Gammaproteobacteria bacterium]
MSTSTSAAVKREARLDTAVAEPTNVLIVGVGGQGVITVSKILAQLCLQNKLKVKQSEIHGMAKRGGAVFSHVRFGSEVYSPTIPLGQADILLALEWAEGLRWLSYLNPDSGTFISDTQMIIPPFSCRDRERGATSNYVHRTLDQVKQHVPNAFAVDATGMATELGNPRTANTVLLGMLSTALDFTVEDWQAIIAQSVPPKTLQVNQKAFVLGREWIQSDKHIAAREHVEEATPPAAPMVDNVVVDLEITEAWCKGCDICVKMCPERCLVLNSNEIVELTDPDACTGCRLCEWLCPDFAIAVHVQKIETTVAEHR